MQLSRCSRSAGWRIGQNLPDLVQLVLRHCQQAGEGNDELKEACLQVGKLLITRPACNVPRPPNTLPHNFFSYIPFQKP